MLFESSAHDDRPEGLPGLGERHEHSLDSERRALIHNWEIGLDNSTTNNSEWFGDFVVFDRESYKCIIRTAAYR
jgi:hypothetical protein